MSKDKKNKQENYIEESKINKFFDIKDLKDSNAGQAIINYSSLGIKAKYYYTETEEEKKKRKNIKNIKNNLDYF
tara:strand:- start:5954 stop:6175 length:222 start_codon:yes stop_codon:yes gene_type:complete